MNKNKGFSLVELIVVVAIMAVLVGILAPAYLSYVEKTRRGADEDAAEEIRHAVEVATAEINVYDELSGGATLNFAKNVSIASVTEANGKSITNLVASLTDVYNGKDFTVKSKLYTQKNGYCVTVSSPTGGTGAALTVTGNWY